MRNSDERTDPGDGEEAAPITGPVLEPQAPEPAVEARAPEPVGEQQAAEPAAVGTEPSAEEQGAGVPPVPPASGRGRLLATAGVTAGVLIFALAFFMAGFAAHALLEDDSGGPSAEAAGSVGLADDPSWGPEDAKVTIEAYSDFQCPYCKKFAEETLPRLRSEYGDRVRFIFRDLPLTSIHPAAALAAQAGGCANAQGRFWEYHDLLYANQESLSEATVSQYAGEAGLDVSQFSDCLVSNDMMVDVLLDMQDAKRLGVTSTPSFVINGLVVSGAQPYELFAALIDQTLAEQ